MTQRKSCRVVGSDLVFAECDGQLANRITYRNRLKAILKEACIDDAVHPHTLRHTFATRGLESGIDLVVMKELLGHSNIIMTADTYTHVMPDRKKDSILKLEDVFPL
jgi:site-specific recombinase XerD